MARKVSGSWDHETKMTEILGCREWPDDARDTEDKIGEALLWGWRSPPEGDIRVVDGTHSILEYLPVCAQQLQTNPLLVNPVE